MSDEAGEKTEQASERRKEDARRKGQVANSREVSVAASLAAIGAVGSLMGAYGFSLLTSTMKYWLSVAGTTVLNESSVPTIALHVGRDVLTVVVPFGNSTEKNAAIYMANQAKKKYPGQVPYFVGGAEPESGPAVLARYQGAVAGVKTVFPSIPKNHIIMVDTNGVDTQAYNNTLSALSAVPHDAVVMLQAVNDEDTGGMAKAAASRGLPNYMVNSYGGDSFGLGQVCSNSHYVGSWYLDPAGWGPVLLSLEMNSMNGVKVPQVTNIAGYEVTAKTAFLHCK